MVAVDPREQAQLHGLPARLEPGGGVAELGLDLGGGGHGRVVAEQLRDRGRPVGERLERLGDRHPNLERSRVLGDALGGGLVDLCDAHVLVVVVPGGLHEVAHKRLELVLVERHTLAGGELLEGLADGDPDPGHLGDRDRLTARELLEHRVQEPEPRRGVGTHRPGPVVERGERVEIDPGGDGLRQALQPLELGDDLLGRVAATVASRLERLLGGHRVDVELERREAPDVEGGVDPSGVVGDRDARVGGNALGDAERGARVGGLAGGQRVVVKRSLEPERHGCRLVEAADPRQQRVLRGGLTGEERDRGAPHQQDSGYGDADQHQSPTGTRHRR
ncbi:hypothetical protein [Egibacter rhizosphaerae]|uniref:hypothetical protein n=1 Tax=Egibacter rhizosphaerae TaxID=1670831 RepID=UPI00197AF935